MDERADLTRRADPIDGEVTSYPVRPDDWQDDDLPPYTTAEQSSPEPADEQHPDEIREDIEDTRTEMSSTIDEIQERLSPQNLMDQAKSSVRDATVGKAERMVSDASDTAKDARNSMMETIKKNPLPAAMVALGVGWLWTHRESTSSKPTTQWGYAGQPQPSSGGIGQAASQAQEKVGQVASQAQDQVGQWTDQAQQQASQLGSQAQDQLQQVKSQFDHLVRENPVAVAAVAIGIGAAAGMMMPQTQQENRWMGETRDQVLDQAQSMAQDTMDKVQKVADKAQHVAQHEANQQGLTSEPT
jgi:ElaB/YqjD/DUF883 family membrane-anchored ribosome-binding protein